MKIKHWQGYGILEAKVIKKIYHHNRYFVDIEVSGNHEYGLDRSEYAEDIFRWLEKVIKIDTIGKALDLVGTESYNYWNNVKCVYEAIDGRKSADGCDLDTCVYHLEFDEIK